MDDLANAQVSRRSWVPLLVGLLLMGGLSTLVLWQWQTLSGSSSLDQEQRFSLAVDSVEFSVRERMRTYEMVLRGMSGLLVGSADVSDDEWQRAADQLQLQYRYPGVQALGWARYLQPEALADFEDRVHASGRVDFHTYPGGERDIYLIVDLVHPLDWRNRRVLGFDMYSEATRRAAIDKARDDGEAVLTGPLRLKQESDQDVQTGVLLYLPVYRQNVPLSTAEERQAALLGMVSGSFRMTDLMRGILGASHELYQIELIDAATPEPPLMREQGEGQSPARFVQQRSLDIYGREWLLRVTSTPVYEASVRDESLSVSLASGLLASLLLSLLVGGFLYQRERALADSERRSRLVRESESRFRLVVEASPNAIVLVDGEGHIAMVNQQTEQMFGYSRAELLGQPVERLLPENLRHSHGGMRKAFYKAPEHRRMGGNRELFGLHRDGRMIPLEVGLSPLRNGDELLVQAVIIDISERKAAEKQLREQAEQLALANRYKSEFLANMSHELRTPLNSILILSEQLRHNVAGNLSEKQVKHADIVYKAGNDLLQLINDVLDLAKIEAGRVQLKLEPVNVHDLLVELDSSLRPMAEIKGLRLITQLEPGVPRVIHSDRGRLQQILRNLLSNALKFTEQGEVELAISRSSISLDDERETLQFVVRDSGIGIDPAQHQRIFQAFQQIDGSTSRRFGGTGLGLAITRQLTEVLGGQISLESQPGQGASFIVRLPVVALMQEAPADERLTSTPQRSGSGPTVLIIEDDANFAAVIAESAIGQGFSYVHCRNGKQAIALLQSERFVAVILDILLPDISGWQIYRRLRGLVQHRDIPVHILSCVPQPQDWQDDGTRYLVKPIGRAALEQVFHDIVMPDDAPAGRLLLVEDVEVEREHYCQHLQQMGFEVHTATNAEQASRVYGEQAFDAVVIDLDLPDQDGFELLETLHRQRSLQGCQVVINTGVDVTRQDLQRLRRYSAVVVRKSGEDMSSLGKALQGFLGSMNEQPPIVSGLSGKRVLLVDDDIRNIYAMTALLDELGLVVVPAKDGVEALEQFAREPLDLILMDMAMPNMDGYTATGILKRERGCRIPVIALTAHAMKGDREKCITAGADDYLAKPVGRQELLEMLHRWLCEPAPQPNHGKAQ